MDIVALPQRGGCICGGFRYALHARPLLAYACHCHDCQTRSGAAFTLSLVVQSADMTVEGEADIHQRTARSGRRVEHTYCPVCRIGVLGRSPASPDYMTIRAGTLDDAGWVVPIAQTFVESAIPWAIIPGVRAVPWPQFDFVALGLDWVASAPPFARAPGA